MKHLPEATVAQLLLVTSIVLLMGCTEGVPSIESVSKRVLSATGGYDVTYYGYAGGQRYEAVVKLVDVEDAYTLESAMHPVRAADLARGALDVIGERAGDLVVCDVQLTKHVHGEGYFYLVNYCPATQKSGVGFRVPVLLSGRAIQPVVSDDDVEGR